MARPVALMQVFLLLSWLLSWLATVVSIVFIGMLWLSGDLGPRGGVFAVAWLLAAGYCQFFAGTTLMSAVGLTLQTLLAVTLIFRWRLSI